MNVAAPAPAPDWVSAWEQALHDLELDVERAEALLRAVHADAASAAKTASAPVWVAPVGLGLLPQSLLERARQVHTRQLAVAHEIAAAAVRSRRELAVARRLAGPVPASRPMFVDASF